MLPVTCEMLLIPVKLPLNIIVGRSMSGYNNQGSIWRRWDPHLHAPGTILNNQFSGDDPWEDYLTSVESSAPMIEALGITDYYSLNVYEQVQSWKANGRLENVALIFANVELRYAVGTDKASPVNFHLLISPDDPNHVVETKRFLTGLTYKHSNGDTYRCTQDDIIRLGRVHKGSSLDDRTALAAGTNQFKVEVDQFLVAFGDSPWMQNNALIAVAVGSTDGTSGLQKDASLSSLRQKIEAAADVIFSSQTKQREFWLGKGVMTPEQIETNYNRCKPCIHGSDAHDLEHVGKPDKERYCWIKGDATFESLRQACMEPELRVRISENAPDGAYASQTIDSISLEGAPWFAKGAIKLNSGLVGVIGPRGSGKSALADMIATGGYDISSHVSKSSFVSRAGELLSGVKSILSWRDGSSSSNEFDNIAMEDILSSPKVRYLSQQFVERLCSEAGADTELVSEFERVIYNSHPKEERLETDNFQSLLALTARRGREERKRHEDALSGIGDRIAKERDKKDDLKANSKRLLELSEISIKLNAERAKLVPKEADAHSKDFDIVSAAANVVRAKIQKAKRRTQALDVLSDHVKAYRDRLADDELASLKLNHRDTELSDDDWAAFKTAFTGDVDGVIKTAKKTSDDLINVITGTSSASSGTVPPITAVTPTFLPVGAPLDSLPLNLLQNEETRLRFLMGVDEAKRKKHEELSNKLRVTEQHKIRLAKAIEDASKADVQITALNKLRSDSYEGVFDGIVAEEKALQGLYKPLSDRLIGATGALGSLTFSIRRRVDVAAWAAKGEALIDKRKEGGFKGIGALQAAAEALLATSWRSGTAKDAALAMTSFRAAYNQTIKNAANIDISIPSEVRKWGAKVSKWLYSTDHITVTYGMQYEGVEIDTLSPGTRGIVLLLLYLAIDIDDDRPLIIDQPEENLDPKSIFDELVGLFRVAKQRRQIIIVTHNANLIVNTDADQVIVAQCGKMQSGQLPEISYSSGSLENPEIRKQVCDILEGGERAFKERAKRLRVTL